MKLNKKSQNAILITLYLSRSGNAKTSHISEGLSLAHPFVQQITRTLRVAGILKSVRGPGGGYCLAGEPTVLEVLRAVGTAPKVDDITNRYGGYERRSYHQFAQLMTSTLNTVLNVKIKDLVTDLTRAELVALEKPSPTELTN